MANPATGQRPLHVLIPVALHERLKQAAKRQDRSVAAETRRALEAHVEAELEKAA